MAGLMPGILVTSSEGTVGVAEGAGLGSIRATVPSRQSGRA
jgi:hypothetical protein